MNNETDFWHRRWREGRIGFHEGQPNGYLVTHHALLGNARRVLVPLCGKTEDLAFLTSRGHQVVGLELVEDAVRAFFSEHQLTPTVSRRGAFTAYTAGAITLLAGDFFDATRDLVGPVDALFDRAAIIALPEPMRERYAAHLKTLLPAGASALVVTVEYPQAQMEGPPFSVAEAELRAHFAGLSVELLAQGPAEGPRLSALGPSARECCFHVRF